MKIRVYIIIQIICISVFIGGCKRDVAGCKDHDATNWRSNVTLDDGSCIYKPLIADPSFELNEWSTYSGTWYSPFAYKTNKADGFMPTQGEYYFKCTPTRNYKNGTLTKQYIGPNKHYKGFYFDYSYTAIAGVDSVLIALVGIGGRFGTPNGAPLWLQNINENAISFNGFPIVIVQKRDQYVEVPYSESGGEITIVSSVSRGTFTFCIDNIREVKR